MQTTKRIMAMALALFLTLGVFAISPMSALAAGDTADQMTDGTWAANPRYIEFGEYNGEPILWRVLEVKDYDASEIASGATTGDKIAFLVADDLLRDGSGAVETRQFHSASHDWNGSDIYAFLNSSGSNQFLENFDTGAQSAIVTSSYTYGGTNSGNTTAASSQVFLLSTDEANNTAYFSGDIDRAVANTRWWLRSPGNYSYFANFVNVAGSTNGDGNTVYTPYGVRPALKVNLSSVIFTSVSVLYGLNPVLTAGVVDRTSDMTATVKFTSNKDGKYYYVIAATAPADALAVKIADGSAGVSVTANIEATVTDPTGLAAGAQTIYIVVEDAAGNLSDVLSILIPAYAPPANTFSLTVVNGTDNTNAGPYAQGAQVSITANAAPAGQVFDYWTSNNGGSFVSANSATTTFTMPAANVTVTAVYKTSGGYIPSGSGSYTPPNTLRVVGSPRVTPLSGTSARLGIQATGGNTPYTYQWQYIGSWIDIPGATSAEFDWTGLTPGQTYTVRCVVKDRSGTTVISPELTFAAGEGLSAFPVKGEITSKNVSVRPEPNIKGKRLGRLQTDDNVSILGYTAPKGYPYGFYKIAWSNAAGYAYISADYVSVTFSSPLGAAITGRVYLQNRMNAAKKYRLATLGNGDAATLLGRYKTWWVVEYDGEKAYLKNGKYMQP